MSGPEVSLFFLPVLMTDFCPRLTGESIAQEEKLGDVSWRCLLAEKMSWKNVVVLLLMEIPLDTEL